MAVERSVLLFITRILSLCLVCPTRGERPITVDRVLELTWYSMARTLSEIPVRDPRVSAARVSALSAVSADVSMVDQIVIMFYYEARAGRVLLLNQVQVE